MSTINWSTAAQFADGREDNYQSTVLARLNIATAGEHTFRLTSDDGSVLRIDGNVVVDHDGLHGDTSKDGAVTLTAGDHDLRIDYIEAGGGQVLKLEWRAPGSSSFVVVPSSVLSTEAGVVRVTAPGNKYCEGATDTAGDGLRLDTVNPNYTLTDIRPPAFQPKVSGMDFLPDGRMVLTTTGDVSSGGWVPNPDVGRGLRPRQGHGHDDQGAGHLHQGRRRAARTRWASRSSTAAGTSPSARASPSCCRTATTPTP